MMEEAKKAEEKKRKEEERKKALDAEMEKKKDHMEKIYMDRKDDMLQEYLETMQGRARTQTWANDDLTGREKLATTESVVVPSSKIKTRVLAVPNRKPGGQGLMVSKTHITFSDDEDSEAEMEQEQKEEEKGEEKDEIKGKKADLVHDESVSDLEYLQSRMTKSRITEQHEDPTEQGGASAGEGSQKEASNVKEGEGDSSALSNPSSSISPPPHLPMAPPPPTTLQANQELILDTGRLFIRNLSYGCTEDEVRKCFERFGPLSEVHLPIHKETKKPKGFGYVLFLMPEHALKAYIAMDGQFFQGRLIHILPGKEKPAPADDADDDLDGQGFKSKKDKKRAATAGDSFNWNTMYMNVSDIISGCEGKRGALWLGSPFLFSSPLPSFPLFPSLMR